MTRIVVTAFLPIACAWAARHESTILLRGVALSAAQADKARQIGVVHPEKVRLLAVDVIPPTNCPLRAIGAKLGFVSSKTIGMTLRYGIYIQTDHWGDRRLLVHELAHPSYSLALKKDGTVVAWGRMAGPRYPVNVPDGLYDVVAIAAGWDDFCLAITTNKEVAERFRH